MPLEAGRGICVFSHTNVAVNEIKEKLGESAQKVLGFPNYVGTLQTFVDRYITFPYLKQIVKVPIHVETVCLLSNRKSDTRVKISVEMEELVKEEKK